MMAGDTPPLPSQRDLRVLVIEDVEDDALLIVRELRRGGYAPRFERVDTPGAMAAALDTGTWDVIIADYTLPKFSAPAALAMLTARAIDVPFIIVSGTIGEETAVAAMKAGAHDYLMKGHLSRLVPAVARELKDAEERRRRAALEQLARRAEKLAALGTLAAGLAHELNNPIGIISSRIELMLLDDAEASALPRGVREDLEVLHRQAQRVARISQGLLSFARQSSTEPGPVDLNQVVEEVLLLAGPQVSKAGVKIRTSLDSALPALSGDPGALQQVILNLITNAWDALEDGGEIRVQTRSVSGEARTIELIVEDTGRGIPDQALAHIFDPFFTTKRTGTGLGLSITHGIVREHGGTIEVESSVGKGTRFVLTFPLRASTDAAGKR